MKNRVIDRGLANINSHSPRCVQTVPLLTSLLQNYHNSPGVHKLARTWDDCFYISTFSTLRRQHGQILYISTGSATMAGLESRDVPLVSKFPTPLLTQNVLLRIFPLLFHMVKCLPISYSFRKQSGDHIYQTVTLFFNHWFKNKWSGAQIWGESRLSLWRVKTWLWKQMLMCMRIWVPWKQKSYQR